MQNWGRRRTARRAKLPNVVESAGDGVWQETSTAQRRRAASSAANCGVEGEELCC